MTRRYAIKIFLLSVLACCAVQVSAAWAFRGRELLQDGQRALQRGQVKLAVHNFKAALAADPKGEKLQRRVSSAYTAYCQEYVGNELQVIIALLHEAYKLDSRNSAVAPLIVQYYTRYARILSSSKTKRLQARALLKKALRLDSEYQPALDLQADLQLRDSQSLQESGDLSAAYKLALAALQRKPGSADAHYLAGQIAYRKQNLAQTKEHYRAAFRLAPIKYQQLSVELTKLAREIALLPSYTKIEEEYFEIHVPEDSFDSREQIDLLGDLLYEAYMVIGEDLGIFPQDPLVVILYKPADFKRISGLPDWAGGLFDGKIRLPLRPESVREADLATLVYHEYTHALVLLNCKSLCPNWFNEGLAIFQGAKKKAVQTEHLRRALLRGHRPQIDRIFRVFREVEDGEEAALMYDEAYSLVSYIEQQYGFASIQALMDQFARGVPFRKACGAVLNINQDGLEEAWRKDLHLQLR